MSKKFTVIYIDKVNQKPSKARDPISIAASKMKTIKIPSGQSEGWVVELVVKQKINPAGSGSGSGSTPYPFTVELLDSGIPYFYGSDVNNERPYTDLPDISIELFRVLDSEKVANAGDALVVQKTDFGYPFINADQVSYTDNEPYLYLTIIPTDAQETTEWEVTMTTIRDIS